jgi:hypothetical protein
MRFVETKTGHAGVFLPSLSQGHVLGRPRMWDVGCGMMIGHRLMHAAEETPVATSSQSNPCPRPSATRSLFGERGY